MLANWKLNGEGLINGRMGLVIILFKLGRFYCNKELYVLAEKHLNKVKKRTIQMFDLSFENGLLGIGYGIEYLSLEEPTFSEKSEYLNQLDKLILQDLSQNFPINDIGLLSGWLGYGEYFKIRLEKVRIESKNHQEEFYRQILSYIIEEIYISVSKSEYIFNEKLNTKQIWNLLNLNEFINFKKYLLPNNHLQELNFIISKIQNKLKKTELTETQKLHKLKLQLLADRNHLKNPRSKSLTNASTSFHNRWKNLNFNSKVFSLRNGPMAYLNLLLDLYSVSLSDSFSNEIVTLIKNCEEK